MDITPMIDITFLLLIFFIVASTMDPTKIGSIPEADNGLAISAKNSAVIIINPGVDDKVVLSKPDGSDFSTDADSYYRADRLFQEVELVLEATCTACAANR